MGRPRRRLASRLVSRRVRVSRPILPALVLLVTSAAVGMEPDEARPANYGIARRVPWTSSRLVGTPEPPARHTTERVFPGLEFDRPVEMQAIPGTDRLVVVEVNGHVDSFRDDPLAGDSARDLFADLSTLDERFHRAYGIAFHPKYEENRYCYVSYVLEPDTPGGSRVSRFEVTEAAPPRLKPDTEQIVITWVSGGHNGAHLQFGPKDGYLYVSTGDGGNSFPPDGRNTGQDVTDLLASILRIDVDHETPPTAKNRRNRTRSRRTTRSPTARTRAARSGPTAFAIRGKWPSTGRTARCGSETSAGRCGR
jgi:glucose/arabinose dehydrogenase